MSDFPVVPIGEVERRRLQSIEEMKRREREEWNTKYQKICDEMYWRLGACCAGCDHWRSDSSLTGQCTAAPIMSGHDVLRSMGITFSSYIPAPGHPYRKAEDTCGAFKDDFDWSTLDDGYLTEIGALKNGQLREKPKALWQINPNGEKRDD